MIGKLKHTLLLITSLLVVAGLGLSALAQSKPGSSDDEIVIGMSTALSGPAKGLGTNMRDGVEWALDEINAKGGVKGRTITLIPLDDGYEPVQTAPNMRKLIEEHKVDAILGNVGTPTAVAAIPIAQEGKTPFVGAFTGAGVLRKDPPDRYVVNYRASYAEETASMVDCLITLGQIKPEEIGFFTQRDAYGDAGFVGGIAALKKHGLADADVIAHGRYERNTIAVQNGLADLLLADPPVKAVIMVGAYAPCSSFIKLAREYELDAIFLNVSFVGANLLAESLGEAGEGVIITQVVPHYDSDLRIVQEYRQAATIAGRSDALSFGSLEGYIATRLLSRALENIDGVPDRESIIDALEAMGEFDLGLSQNLSLSPTDHQASNAIWPTVIRDGVVVPYDWSKLVKDI